jgi:hypothetical protein
MIYLVKFEVFAKLSDKYKDNINGCSKHYIPARRFGALPLRYELYEHGINQVAGNKMKDLLEKLTETVLRASSSACW